MVDEILEGGRLTVLLAHEQQGDERRKDGDSRRELQSLEADQTAQALAQHAVSHLVVVLGEDHKPVGGNQSGRIAVPAPAISRVLAGVHKALGKGLRQLLDAPEVAVVPVPLARQQGVEGAVEVVVPLRIQPEAAELRGPDHAHVVQVALRDQIHPAVQPLGKRAHRVAEFGQKRPRAQIHHAVDGVEAERVHMERRQPLDGILDEEAHDFVALRPVEVEAQAPRSPVAVAEVWAKIAEIVSFRPQVVVDHVEHDGDLALVTGVDETL